ncbi:MAG: hypothetical protein ACREYE_07695 [Gammaproteobacteria bacterium]
MTRTRNVAHLGGLLSAECRQIRPHCEYRKNKRPLRLRELAKCRAAAACARQRADLSASPEWKVFQEAVDALGGMARATQPDGERQVRAAQGTEERLPIR